MLRDGGTAEEIVQDVMLELWRRREALEVPKSTRAYLLQATRNRALNHLRHLAIERRSEPYVAEMVARVAPTDAQLREREIQGALREAVDTLPDRCREVFELSRVKGLRYAEIAAALGISVKTVEVQMGKALRILRERLAPWMPSGDSL
jgi:RNA polymerase sigma-70 factor (ECF subfamily)